MKTLWARLLPRLPAGQFAGAAALLIFASAVMFSSIFQTARVERDLERVDDELLRLQSLSASVHRFGELNTEYLAIGGERAFEAAQAARREAAAELAEVRRMAGRRRGWYEWVEELAPIIERRISVSSEQAAVRRAKGAAPALAWLARGQSDRLDDDIDRRLDDLQEDALALQETQRQRLRQRSVAGAVIFGCVVLLSLSLLSLAFRTLRREVAAHRDTAQKRARAEAASRDFAGALVKAEQRERRRLALILHDNLQQTLAAAAMHLNLIQSRETDPALKESAGLAGGILKEAVQTTRSLSYDLCPPDIARGSLGRALQWLGDQMRLRHKLDVKVSLEQQPPDLPDSVRDFLLSATRELLFNVVKHAKTSQAGLSVSMKPGLLLIEVSDEGAGFDPEKARSAAAGLGLADTRERIALFGGSIEVRSRPAGGCRVVLSVPVSAA